jgi:hypothetical protein
VRRRAENRERAGPWELRLLTGRLPEVERRIAFDLHDDVRQSLALENPAGARAEFLAAACPDDADLRRRVEILLRAHANPVSFLAGPAVEPPTGSYAAADAPTEDRPPPRAAGAQGRPVQAAPEARRGRDGRGVDGRADRAGPPVGVGLPAGPDRAVSFPGPAGCTDRAAGAVGRAWQSGRSRAASDGGPTFVEILLPRGDGRGPIPP